MTSSISFFKCMIQDLKHRVWQIALSCLGSFLGMPILYLLYQQGWNETIAYRTREVYDVFDMSAFKIECITDCFGQYFVITGGIVAIAGALLVGIFGFQFVFSKKAIDQYHSIPITRKNMFLVHYVNGFLIWFVPMLISVVMTGVLSIFFLQNFGLWVRAIWVLTKTVLDLVIAFLLVYHLAIVAVMISGNILNTLVNGTIIAFAVIALTGMYEVFAGQYFATHYSNFNLVLERTIWASPIPAAIYQLVMGAAEEYVTFAVIMNVIMIPVLWVAGFIGYLKRPSELAEQGMKIKSIQVLFRGIITLLAGLFGWGVFHLIGRGLVWRIFGTVLFGVLCHGILDIIFHMDFKAFFKHKMQMACMLVFAALVGASFQYDWFGYDTYLPRKENIEELGIFVNGYANLSNNYIHNGKRSEKHRIDDMEFEDKDLIYAFLQKAVAEEPPIDSSLGYDTGRNTWVSVRVEKENGKSYYRTYRIDLTDQEVIMPILTSEEYLETNVLIPEDVFRDLEAGKGIISKDERLRIDFFTEYKEVYDTTIISEIFAAYNEDIRTNATPYFLQNSGVVASINFYGRDVKANRSYYMDIDVYETMPKTVAVLEKHGLLMWDAIPTAEDIEKLEIVLYGIEDKNIKQMLGLEEWVPSDKTAGKVPADYPQYVDAKGAVVTVDTMEQVTVAYEPNKEYLARIKDKEIMAELLPKFCYQQPSRWAVFDVVKMVSGEVRLYMNNGDIHHAELYMGSFPEEYVDLFEAKISNY